MPPPPNRPERPTIETVATAILRSYEADPRTCHIDAGNLPNRYQAIELLERLRDLVFPGYYTHQPVTASTVRDHVVRLVAEIRERLEQQVAGALGYKDHLDRARGRAVDADPPLERGRRITDAFLEQVPDLRAMLGTDVQAAYDGDPAARNTDETVFCYPGIDAIFTYRVAHALHELGVPMIPRILSEYLHNETGIDIHPAARIGPSFFIDHGTGVVIGETTQIGERVKLYQGVTLGAMSFPRDEQGRLIRDIKRHPTIEDDVTIYANATILGGQTIIGSGCVIGGSVFLTKSVPPGHFVTVKAPELKYRSADRHQQMFRPPPDTDPV
ncbi:MAG: serine acetyltransferase [Phycisphaerae bacterium]|nr:serine acetyltransferase [Phycisphaerae bacterium]